MQASRLSSGDKLNQCMSELEFCETTFFNYSLSEFETDLNLVQHIYSLYYRNWIIFRNCTVAMKSCLSEERAEVVLTRDFARF